MLNLLGLKYTNHLIEFALAPRALLLGFTKAVFTLHALDLFNIVLNEQHQGVHTVALGTGRTGNKSFLLTCHDSSYVINYSVNVTIVKLVSP